MLSYLCHKVEPFSSADVSWHPIGKALGGLILKHPKTYICIKVLVGNVYFFTFSCENFLLSWIKICTAFG